MTVKTPLRCGETFRLSVIAALSAILVQDGRAWDLQALRGFLPLEPDQWQTVQAGGVAAKAVSRSDGREVVVLGVTRVQASVACFVDQFRDIETFKKGKAVLAVGKFTAQLSRDDFTGISLTAEELDQLHDCEPGDCSLKLPEDAIGHIRRAAGWPAPTRRERAQTLFREWLREYLAGYLSRGNSALVEYADRERGIRLEDEFRSMLDARPHFGVLAPELHKYLANNSGDPPAGVEQFLYWSKESFGLKPVLTVTEVSIAQEKGSAVIASKQLYASHYFDASLGLSFAVDDPSSAQPAMYLAYLNRSRIDLLDRFLSGLRRSVARGRLLDGMRENLKEVSKRVGAACSSG